MGSTPKVSDSLAIRSRRRLVFVKMAFAKERNFMFFVVGALLLSGLVYPYPQVAMWLGFLFAAYSAIANDSIQTIGTFLASNANRKWWHLWLFIGLIFVGVVTTSWLLYDGDVTFQRLATKGFEQAPQQFQYLQIAAPIILLILTRMRMPVSTTFLLLSSFTTKGGAIFSVMEKSVLGYVIAFGSALLMWMLLSRFIKKLLKGPAHPAWDVAQWLTSGSLWAIWIMQDAANIAVYLPRQLSLNQFLVFTGVVFFGLAFLFYLRGDKIQKVIEEKSDVKDVRSATVIDLVYTLILIVFQYMSTVPMSTTWVFIGLLGGRELGMRIMHREKGKKYKHTWRLIGKDLLYALIGLVISILLAFAVNPIIQKEIMALLN